jgi:hypothetical protein
MFLTLLFLKARKEMLMPRTTADINAQGAIKASEGQAREKPFIGKKLRGAYHPGERLHTFDKNHVIPQRANQAAVQPPQSFAFSGRGFMPNLFGGHALVTLPEASATSLENEGVHGREGMMPAAGVMTRAQAGQHTDEGSGGAGSFASVHAFGAKG